MRYEKPELIALGAAVDAVQAFVKVGGQIDCQDAHSANECPPPEN